MRYILLGIILTLSPFTVKAEELPFPALTGRVVDTANEIPDDQQAILEKELADFEKNTKHQFVVVTIPDLKGNDVDEYTNKLARHWGIGRASADDGIILLQSSGDGKPGSGKIRIEVGYGMEYILTDVRTGRIIRDVMVPILKRDKPRSETTPEAIITGAREIMRLGVITPEQITENERIEREAVAKQAAAVKDFFLTLGMFILGVISVVTVGVSGWLLVTRKKRAKLREEKFRQEQERQRLLEEQRERDRIAAEKRDKELREQRERQAKAHAEMLAAMTPAQRSAYDAEQRRLRSEQMEAQQKRNEQLLAEQLKRRRIAREAEERENNLRIQRQEEERNRPSYSSYNYGSSYSSNDSSSSSSSDSFSGGGGDFGGGGSSDSY